MTTTRGVTGPDAPLVSLATWVTLSTAWPGAAWALCPNCLGQQSALTPTLKLVGLFLLVPFAVAAVVVLVVRRTLYGRAPAPTPASIPASGPASGGGGAQAG